VTRKSVDSRNQASYSGTWRDDVHHCRAFAAAVTTMGNKMKATIIPPRGAATATDDRPFIEAILICFNAGLVWMLALVLILVRREQGSLSWPVVRDAL
jgi:uncharacterized protein